jgi:membrane fusion protein (multidrug efflux system)
MHDPVCRSLAPALRLLAVGVTGLGIFLAVPNGAAAEEALAVDVVSPERADVVRYVSLPGRIHANQEATLYAKVSGYLRTLLVDKGDRVHAGTSIGDIEVPELTAELMRYRAEAKAADAELARVTAARAKAPDLVVPQTVDEARARLEIARAQIERIETLLRYAHLTAPFAGIVTARFVDPGAFIPAATAGNAAGAAIVTLMDFDTVRVRVPVPEREAALVEPGQPLHFRVDVLGNEEVPANISRVSYAIDPGSQTMLVEATVENRGLRLRPGMFVTARIGVERHAGVWTLPVEAVDLGRAGASVLVHDNGQARRVRVEVGFIDGKRAEVSSGLHGNEAVIIAASAPLVDGARVRVEAASQ